jgi:hypothetical protein
MFATIGQEKPTLHNNDSADESDADIIVNPKIIVETRFQILPISIVIFRHKKTANGILAVRELVNHKHK